jgi:hypothetical protein
MGRSFKYYDDCFDAFKNTKTTLDNSVYEAAGVNCAKQMANSVSILRELSKGKEITVEIDEHEPMVINTETIPPKLISKIDDEPHDLKCHEIIAVDKRKSQIIVLPYTGKRSKTIILTHEQFCLFHKEYGFGLLPDGPFFDFTVKETTGRKFSLLSFGVLESKQNELGL